MDELHDIKPLEPIFSVPWWAWVLLAVLVVKVAVLIALLRRRRAGPPPISVMQRLQNELGSLTAPADEAAALVFQTRLVAVLRGWVEERFAIRATDMTQEELTRDLDLGRALGAELRGEFLSLLALADETRFAGAPVALARHSEALERTRRFIAQTMPPPEEPNAGGTTS